MPTITQGISKEYLQAYSGYNQQEVGLGLLNPGIYSTPVYQGKKIKNIALGLVSDVSYAGAEHDRSPQILTMGYEIAYNTIIAYNLHYGTPRLRQAMLKFVLEQNAARIRSNQPIVIDYHALKLAIPDSQFLVRRYKIVGLTPHETYPLIEWPEIAKQRNKFDGFYQQFKR